MRGAPDRAPGGLVALAIGVLAVFCCGAVPLLAALVGSLALGVLLGGGAVLLGAALVIATLVVRLRRRRRSCRATSPTA